MAWEVKVVWAEKNHRQREERRKEQELREGKAAKWKKGSRLEEKRSTWIRPGERRGECRR